MANGGILDSFFFGSFGEVCLRLEVAGVVERELTLRRGRKWVCITPLRCKCGEELQSFSPETEKILDFQWSECSIGCYITVNGPIVG